MNRADESLGLAAVTQSPAGRVDARRERRFRNDTAVPDGFQQIVAADHLVAIDNEEGDEVEDLRLDRNRRFGSAKLAPVRIENEILESKVHEDLPRGRCRAATIADRGRRENHALLKEISRRSQGLRAPPGAGFSDPSERRASGKGGWRPPT